MGQAGSREDGGLTKKELDRMLRRCSMDAWPCLVPNLAAALFPDHACRFQRLAKGTRKVTLADLQQVPELSGNPFITRCTARSWMCEAAVPADQQQIGADEPAQPTGPSLPCGLVGHARAESRMAPCKKSTAASGGHQAVMQRSAADAAAHPHPLTAAAILVALQDLPDV